MPQIGGSRRPPATTRSLWGIGSGRDSESLASYRTVRWAERRAEWAVRWPGPTHMPALSTYPASPIACPNERAPNGLSPALANRSEVR